MGLTPDELIAEIKESDARTLCLCLLYKRENDGLNGRTWDSDKQLIWENRVCAILTRHGYLGHTGNKAKDQVFDIANDDGDY